MKEDRKVRRQRGATYPRSFIVDSKLPKWRRLLPPRKPPPAPTRPLTSAAPRPAPPRPPPRSTPGAWGPACRRSPAPRAAQPYLRRCPLSRRRRSRRPGRANSAPRPLPRPQHPRPLALRMAAAATPPPRKMARAQLQPLSPPRRLCLSCFVAGEVRAEEPPWGENGG